MRQTGPAVRSEHIKRVIFAVRVVAAYEVSRKQIMKSRFAVDVVKPDIRICAEIQHRIFRKGYFHFVKNKKQQQLVLCVIDQLSLTGSRI